MSGRQRTVRRQLFPEKLWDLVSKPASGIQWSADGKRIEVDKLELEKCLGTKFRLHKFDSFIRQLHLYGFKKCGNSYHHEKFQRGRPETLLTMKRKYSNQLARQQHQTSISSYYNSNSTSTTNGTSNNSSPSLPVPTSAHSLARPKQTSNLICNNYYQSSRFINEDCAIDYSLKSRLIMRCISVKNNSAAIHNKNEPMAAAAKDQEK